MSNPPPNQTQPQPHELSENEKTVALVLFVGIFGLVIYFLIRKRRLDKELNAYLAENNGNPPPPGHPLYTHWMDRISYRPPHRGPPPGYGPPPPPPRSGLNFNINI